MLSSHDMSLERDYQGLECSQGLEKSSQESLPLSQETFETLVNGLLGMGNGTESLKNATDLSRRLEDNLFSSEKLELLQFGSNQVSYAPQLPLPVRQSSVPALSDWPGDFDFKVFFDDKEPLSKKVNWTYSATHNRLYIKKNQVCPINFATNRPMGGGYYIRAMLVYPDPQYCTEVVKRCVYHSKQEVAAGLFEAEHLMRSASSEASYTEDKFTQRHSVCVPFEDPTAGQNFSSYLFQFLCFNSCAGGPNRRQMTIVFTLEKISCINTLEVVGRKCFGLKVCACPGRDRGADEGDVLNSEQLEAPSGPPTKKKFKENHVVPYPSNVLSAKSNSSRKKPREYIIKVKDENSYKFLMEMKKVSDIGTQGFLVHMKNIRELFRISKEQQHFVPILNAYVNYVSSNSDERSEDDRM